MRQLVHLFAYNKAIITDDLVRSRYEASIRPGFQETFSSMFPVPRQAGIKMLATPEDAIRALPHEVLVIHGRDDQIIPLASSVRLHSLLRHSDLHVFGECGHWTQIERKDRFASMVAEFFSRGLQSRR